MEGKKIAFIVVAIATVGVAYYLYNKNKQVVSTYPIKPSSADAYKFGEPKSQYAIKESTPIVDSNVYDDSARRKTSNIASTGYFKPTE